MWTTDRNGDSWIGDAMENPGLVLANPAKGKSHKKGGPKKGVMPEGLRRYWANYFGAKMKNPPAAAARPSYRSVALSGVRQGAVELIKAPKRRAKTFESQYPVAASVIGVGAGFVTKGIVSAKVLEYMPVSMQGPTTTWLVKAGSALVPGYVVRRLLSKKLGLSMMVGGAVALVLDVAKAYGPSWLGLGSQTGLGYYVPGAAFDAPGMRRQIGMGMYTGAGRDVYPEFNPASALLATAPTRVNPRERF